MAVYLLPEEPVFPPPHLAEPNGLLAVGGDLSPTRLLAAYSSGIFPWYSAGDPILWWSPDPRYILEADQLHIPRSLRKSMRKGVFSITFDTAFAEVIQACASPQGSQRDTTWITAEMQAAYIELHRLGYAHSIEAWLPQASESFLAGGLYGVALGSCFFGESMFYRHPDASKTAFVTLVHRLKQLGFTLIDCQMKTNHLSRFGAVEIPRKAFLHRVVCGMNHTQRPQSWRLQTAP